MGELVVAYDIKASNKTLHPKPFYVLYIEPNASGTSHSVFKLPTKQILTVPKYKLMLVPEDIFKHMFDKKYRNQKG